MIASLIRLLDDPDEKIYSAVKEQILKLGAPVEKDLLKLTTSNNKLVKERAQLIIKHLNLTKLEKQLTELHSGSKNCLLDSLLTISDYFSTDKDKDFVKDFFTIKTKDFWIELNDNLTALEKAKVIKKLVFDVYGFKVIDTKSVNDYSISNVIKQKKGAAIIIAIIIIEICRKLSIPFFGSAIPKNILLPYTENNTILFYLNICKSPDFVSLEEVTKLLADSKSNSSLLYPCSEKELIKLVLMEIQSCYQKNSSVFASDLKRIIHNIYN